MRYKQYSHKLLLFSEQKPFPPTWIIMVFNILLFTSYRIKRAIHLFLDEKHSPHYIVKFNS